MDTLVEEAREFREWMRQERARLARCRTLPATSKWEIQRHLEYVTVAGEHVLQVKQHVVMMLPLAPSPSHTDISRHLVKMLGARMQYKQYGYYRKYAAPVFLGHMVYGQSCNDGRPMLHWTGTEGEGAYGQDLVY